MMCWKKLFFKSGVVFFIPAFLFLLSEAVFSSVSHANSLSGTNEIHGGDFTLNSAKGPLSLSDLRGSVVLIFFGYTSCPTVCPISLATISNVFFQMSPDELKRTKALFISLDPEKDNLELLKQYTDYFHPNILGLTDDTAVVTKVAEQYGVKYKKILVPESALGYVISHSSDIFVLDHNGKLCETFPHDTDTPPLLAQIKILLKNSQ